ncbi:hypothetical protein [Dactylosporangium sp. NPDC051541]|uniref:hypothetical protein n=1 Tax=Dactylosporangium sp. NPDC051541 TaxID=3363977 RepID=UPI0037AF5B49
MNLVWRVADDPAVVHRIIEASDRRASQRSGKEPPKRRIESTRALVAAGLVHVGHLNARPSVTVTVGETAPFDVAESGLPAAEHPRYMQRLAVDPDADGALLLGFHAGRHAVAVATAAGADALRAETNPDYNDVVRMLAALGFEPYRTDDSGPQRRIYLQRPIPLPGPGAPS